jgi:hypothetical protein
VEETCLVVETYSLALASLAIVKALIRQRKLNVAGDCFVERRISMNPFHHDSK